MENDFCEYRNDGLHLQYIANFYDCSFEKLLDMLPLEPVTFQKRFHNKFKKCVPRRKVCAFSDFIGRRYEYGGQYVIAKKTWPPLIQNMKNAVENKLGEKFNYALVNYYPDGNSHISRHQDNEKDMIPTKPIACLSFGATRQLKFRNKYNGSNFVFSPKHGSLYVMRYPTNEKWTHEIPKQIRIHQPRISITFRTFK